MVNQCLVRVQTCILRSARQCMVAKRSMASEAAAAAASQKEISMPPPSGVDRNFSPKLHKIVDDIEKLTLLEASDLNELLRIRLNIKDVPMAMAAGPMLSAAKAGGEEEEQEKVKIKSAYTVKLTGFDDTKKVALIKEMKAIVPGMNLVQAKKFVESVPQLIRKDISKEEADKLKASLEALGAQVSVE
ncbi:mitochondrial ribosomal protein L12 [Brevipalpus obovatus]|uniref:mitochondrial ribosomal protein L12 n=1 Tax=Brevipalpus obovatus TaxID=246614 RepID=UPI003D9E059C